MDFVKSYKWTSDQLNTFVLTFFHISNTLVQFIDLDFCLNSHHNILQASYITKKNQTNLKQNLNLMYICIYSIIYNCFPIDSTLLGRFHVPSELYNCIPNEWKKMSFFFCTANNVLQFVLKMNLCKACFFTLDLKYLGRFHYIFLIDTFEIGGQCYPNI